jgi:hypothetical protein
LDGYALPKIMEAVEKYQNNDEFLVNAMSVLVFLAGSCVREEEEEERRKEKRRETKFKKKKKVK